MKKNISSFYIVIVTIFAASLILFSHNSGFITIKSPDSSYYQITRNLVHFIENPSSLNYIQHDSIEIISDADFMTYGFPGSGTEIDPYIIENYEIISSSDDGIYIRDTTKYFIIRSCYIDAGYNCIDIRNIAEGTASIIENTCTGNQYGVVLRYSSGSTITNNTFSNCYYYGISLGDSYACLITYNLLKENRGFGIRLSLGSKSTIIHHNYFIDNFLGRPQARDDGKNNKWFDSETNEGNWWSDLGTDCTYEIEGRAHPKDLYPLNRPPDCPANPLLIPTISIVIPVLVCSAGLAFVVPKYGVPYLRKRKTERHLRKAKISEEDRKKKKKKRKLIIWSIILVAGLACFIPSLYGFIEHFTDIGVFAYIPPLIISTLMVFISSLMLILFIKRSRNKRKRTIETKE